MELGRYLIVQGFLIDNAITLVDVYGPNSDSPEFFENLFLIFASKPGYSLIGGDFNVTLNPHLVRRNSKDMAHTQSRKIFIVL